MITLSGGSVVLNVITLSGGVSSIECDNLEWGGVSSIECDNLEGGQ